MREVVGAEAYEIATGNIARALAGERIAYQTVLPYREGARHVDAQYIPHIGPDGRTRASTPSSSTSPTPAGRGRDAGERGALSGARRSDRGGDLDHRPRRPGDGHAAVARADRTDERGGKRPGLARRGPSRRPRAHAGSLAALRGGRDPLRRRVSRPPARWPLPVVQWPGRGGARRGRRAARMDRRLHRHQRAQVRRGAPDAADGGARPSGAQHPCLDPVDGLADRAQRPHQARLCRGAAGSDRGDGPHPRPADPRALERGQPRADRARRAQALRSGWSRGQPSRRDRVHPAAAPGAERRAGRARAGHQRREVRRALRAGRPDRGELGRSAAGRRGAAADRLAGGRRAARRVNPGAAGSAQP